jgi:UDP-glucose 4-epimerase
MARCLVLGANGFIGSHVVDALAKNGHFVRCFDRYKSNVVQFNNGASYNTEIYHGDFLSNTSVEKALEDVEYVFHFVSTTNPFISEADPELDIETNILHSVKLFEACVTKKIKKVIFASTSAIYGDHPEIRGPISESVHEQPYSPYAIGKLTIENYLRFFKRKFDLDYLIFRVSNPYGPRQNTMSGQGVIGIFLKHAANSTPINVYGDGSMVRDYIYVQDVAKAFAQVFDKQAKHNIYNVGSGSGRSINDIIATVEAATGKKLQKIFVETPTSFVQKVILDTSRIESEFNIRAETTLEQGIKETLRQLK